MRLVHTAAVTVAALLLASAGSAQGLGDVAAREKQKRKAAPAKPAKVYTESDIGHSAAPASATPELPATADAAAAAQGQGEGGKSAAEGKAVDPEKAAEEARAKAEADWRKRLEDARREEAAYQDTIGKVQLALADTSNLYNPGRAANATLLEDSQKKLAEVKSRIASLEEEGRRSGYR